jgi:hypothetical protein
MSKRPGRKPAARAGPTSKSQLSSDTKIIIALMKKQPLTKKEICLETKISEQTLYRKISILNDNHITKCVDQKYALWNFDPLETQIENAFSNLFKHEGCWFVTQNHIASELGMPWSQIEALTLEVAKRLGSKIVPKDGKYTFYKPGTFQNSSN